MLQRAIDEGAPIVGQTESELLEGKSIKVRVAVTGIDPTQAWSQFEVGAFDIKPAGGLSGRWALSGVSIQCAPNPEGGRAIFCARQILGPACSERVFREDTIVNLGCLDSQVEALHVAMLIAHDEKSI